VIKKFLINENNSIKQAINSLDEISRNYNCLLVKNKKNQIIGSITDGDIRRSLVKKSNFNLKVKNICNRNFFFFYEKDQNINKIKKIISNRINNIDIVPILNNDRKLIKTYTKKNFQKKIAKKINNLDKLKVFILAGGYGTRLKPATNILPKPLIPIGDKTLIESVIKKFYDQGIKEYFISINYKKELIKAYFKDLKLDYKVNFIEEKKTLGTAGSISYLKNVKGDNFIVTNCDTIIDVNIKNLIEFQKQRKIDLTIVVNYKNYNLPYGEIEIDRNGNFIKIKEKPNYKFLINSGLYLMNKKVISIVKKNEFLNMNDLINKITDKKLNIGLYPITGNSWIDVGKWSEYKKFKKQTS
jgi:dTDP-glucose pyrophosphorylase